MSNLQELLNYSSDSMGLDVVVYWPRIAYKENAETLDEDDE